MIIIPNKLENALQDVTNAITSLSLLHKQILEYAKTEKDFPRIALLANSTIHHVHGALAEAEAFFEEEQTHNACRGEIYDIK